MQTTRIFPLGISWNRSFGLYPSDTAFLPIDTLLPVGRVLEVEREGNLAPSLPEADSIYYNSELSGSTNSPAETSVGGSNTSRSSGDAGLIKPISNLMMPMKTMITPKPTSNPSAEFAPVFNKRPKAIKSAPMIKTIRPLVVYLLDFSQTARSKIRKRREGRTLPSAMLFSLSALKADFTHC